MRITPFDKKEITGICVIEQTMFINITKRIPGPSTVPQVSIE